MESISITELKDKINKSAATHTPFLFIVDFEMTKGIFIENPLKEKNILFSCPLGNNIGSKHEMSDYDKGLSMIPISFDEYQKKIDIVMKGIRRGDSFLTNLTIKTPIKTSLSLEQIFYLSHSPYRIYIPKQFVCFSPESFVKISDRIISTYPMKGTINARIADAEKIIMADKKETAEHYTIVDLLRNDLGIVADNIRVNRFRYIDRIKTNESEILQVSSEITGRLQKDYLSRLGDIILGMLPAGSVSGAPKKKTIEIIQDAEKESRGFYTGVFGYFDGKELDSAVLIRYIEESDGEKYFRSGGGITIYSDSKKEYNEVLEKIYLPFV